MKFAENRGYQIAYDVYGEGQAVVLQHGLMESRHGWKEFGYVDLLTNNFKVITIDSLGHGDSDKPSDPKLYNREERVKDVIAVLDAEKINKTHYVGYSMGSWIGIGILKHKPDRLLSISLGGWDPAPNELLSALSQMTIDDLIGMVPEDSSELVSWVTPDVKPGLEACLSALGITEIPADVLINSGVPIHLWVGEEDPYSKGLNEIHKKMPGSKLNMIEGNHIPAFRDKNSPIYIQKFIENI
ncbi:alpha/beta fold hydrolase [Chloroflexota bacterium]